MGGVMLDYLVDDSLGESIRHQLGLKFCRNPQPQSTSRPPRVLLLDQDVFGEQIRRFKGGLFWAECRDEK